MQLKITSRNFSLVLPTKHLGRPCRLQGGVAPATYADLARIPTLSGEEDEKLYLVIKCA